MEAHSGTAHTSWFNERQATAGRIAELETVVRDLQRQVSDLETALTNARIIGAAVGVVMVRRRLPYDRGMGSDAGR